MRVVFLFALWCASAAHAAGLSAAAHSRCTYPVQGLATGGHQRVLDLLAAQAKEPHDAEDAPRTRESLEADHETLLRLGGLPAEDYAISRAGKLKKRGERFTAAVLGDRENVAIEIYGEPYRSGDNWYIDYREVGSRKPILRRMDLLAFTCGDGMYDTGGRDVPLDFFERWRPVRSDLPDPSRLKELRAKYKSFVRDNADKYELGIGQDGTIKRRGDWYNIVRFGGGMEARIEVFGLPYEKDGKLYIDYRMTSDGFEDFEPKPILSRMSMTRFLHEATPQFMLKVKPGSDHFVPVKKDGMRGAATLARAKVLKVHGDKVEMRGPDGDKIWITHEELMMHNGLYHEAEMAKLHGFFKSGGRGDVVREIPSAPIRSTGGRHIEDGYRIVVKEVPEKGVWDAETVAALKAAQRDGIQVLYVPRTDVYNAAVAPPSEVARMHGRFPRAIGVKPLMLVTPDADRFTIVHERKHIDDNPWFEATFDKLKAVADRNVLPYETLNQILYFVGEQRAFAADNAARKAAGKDTKRALTLATLDGGYGGKKLSGVLTALKQADAAVYGRVIEIMKAGEEPSAELPLSAILPAHFK